MPEVTAASEKAQMLRCAANLVAQRIIIYASLFGFCAPCLWSFLQGHCVRVIYYFMAAPEKYYYGG
jgi:hypothetical protein